MAGEWNPPATRAIMARPLERLVGAAVRRPVVTLAIAGAAVAIALLLTLTQLGFCTSRSAVLSPESDYNRRWLKYTAEFGDKEDVVVVVEGQSREQIIPALDELVAGIERRPDMFDAVLHQTDAPQLRAKGLYYLDVSSADPNELDLRKLDALLDRVLPILGGDWSLLSLGGFARQMSAAAAPSSSSASRQQLAALQQELPRFVEGLRSALAGERPAKSLWPDMSLPKALAEQSAETRLTADDGRSGFILLRFVEADTQSFTQNNRGIAALRQLAAETQQRHPGVKVGLSGLPVIEHDEMLSSERSMTAATLLSFFGVLAVMIVAFGGWRHSTMAMGVLTAAMVCTCGGVALAVGHVNVLTIAFGSILFGMGIDYGIYFIAQYLRERKHTELTDVALTRTARLIGPGILAGAATSTISFLAAGMTDFPGVAQLGLIAAAGIMLCWLAQSTVLPALIRLTDRDGPRRDLPEPLNLRRWLRPLYVRPKIALACCAGLTVLMAVGLGELRYDYNLLNLQPEGLESVDLEHKLFQQANRSAWFALSVCDSPDEVLARREAFLKLPSVERVEEIITKLPRDCASKQPWVERIHRRLVNLPPAAPPIPVMPLDELRQMLVGMESLCAAMPEGRQAAAGLRQLGELLTRITPEEYHGRVGRYQQALAADLLGHLQALRAASSPEPPALADLPPGVLTRFVGRNGRHAMRVYSKSNIWEMAPMGRFVAEVRSIDPEATGNPMQVFEATREMKRSFEHAACYALLAIVPVLLLDFRRLNHLLLAALPMSIGLLQTLGLMGWLDIPLNPANMIFLPLTLGLGMDTGINLIHEFRRQGSRYRGAGNAVLVAVCVNSLTTMVGFGALMIAQHRGLQSLGRVLTISMGFSILNSLMLPNLLVLGKFAAADNTAAEKDAADTLADSALQSPHDEIPTAAETPLRKAA
jgi:hopanoid biosynthesis associated RND transporter like protein HpnN